MITPDLFSVLSLQLIHHRLINTTNPQ